MFWFSVWQVGDFSIHDSLAVFTAILIARHCFTLEELVGQVALQSLLAACPSGVQICWIYFITKSTANLLVIWSWWDRVLIIADSFASFLIPFPHFPSSPTSHFISSPHTPPLTLSPHPFSSSHPPLILSPHSSSLNLITHISPPLIPLLSPRPLIAPHFPHPCPSNIKIVDQTWVFVTETNCSEQIVVECLMTADVCSVGSGGDPDCEPGARLTCHLLLRLFQMMNAMPGCVPDNRKNVMYVKLSCDRHLLEAAHKRINIGAVVAVLKAILMLGEQTEILCLGMNNHSLLLVQFHKIPNPVNFWHYWRDIVLVRICWRRLFSVPHGRTR